MRKVIVSEWMSLDGVVQAPAYADEDSSGGFKHGGWHLRYFEERSMSWVVETINRAGGFLFGRRTYDVFAAHWPNASPEEQMLAQPLNALPKYVASRTLKEPLAWQNSTLLDGPLATPWPLRNAKRARRGSARHRQHRARGRSPGAQSRRRAPADDRSVFLGGGKRFFRDDGVCRHWIS